MRSSVTPRIIPRVTFTMVSADADTNHTNYVMHVHPNAVMAIIEADNGTCSLLLSNSGDLYAVQESRSEIETILDDALDIAKAAERAIQESMEAFGRKMASPEGMNSLFKMVGRQPNSEDATNEEVFRTAMTVEEIARMAAEAEADAQE